MPRVPALQAEQTRRDILAGALTVFAARGYAATRIADVAAELGVTRGAVYGHFPNKAELFLEVVRLSQDPIYALLEAQDTGATATEAGGPLRRFVRGWLLLLRDNPCHRASFELVMNKSAFVDELAVLYRREKKLTRDVIAAATRWLQECGVEDPGFAALHLYTHLMGITQSWLFNPRLFSLHQSLEALTDHVLRGAGIPDTAAHAAATV